MNKGSKTVEQAKAGESNMLRGDMLRNDIPNTDIPCSFCHQPMREMEFNPGHKRLICVNWRCNRYRQPVYSPPAPEANKINWY